MPLLKTLFAPSNQLQRLVFKRCWLTLTKISANLPKGRCSLSWIAGGSTLTHWSVLIAAEAILNISSLKYTETNLPCSLVFHLVASLMPKSASLSGKLLTFSGSLLTIAQTGWASLVCSLCWKHAAFPFRRWCIAFLTIHNLIFWYLSFFVSTFSFLSTRKGEQITAARYALRYFSLLQKISARLHQRRKACGEELLSMDPAPLLQQHSNWQQQLPTDPALRVSLTLKVGLAKLSLLCKTRVGVSSFFEMPDIALVHQQLPLICGLR